MAEPSMHAKRFLTMAALRAFSFLLVLVLLPACWQARGAGLTLTNGTQFRDTEGNVIHAHGGGILKSGGYYYWYGEHRDAHNHFVGVSCYRSTNLAGWEYRGDVLKSTSDPELNRCVIERPKVLHNESTGQYVMWMHRENGSDYRQARAAVAYASAPDGEYTYQGSFRPAQDQGISDHGLPGYMSRDCNVFQDTDDTAYFISAANENLDLHLYKLTPDYRRIDKLAAVLFPGAQREAPCLFKRGRYYFLVTSQCTGWSPNQAGYAWSTNLVTGWSPLHNLADYNTYHSQPACIIPVQGSSGTAFLYSGDRWAGAWGAPVGDSQYVWLPLSFPSDTSLALHYADICTIDAARGQITIPVYYAILNAKTGKALNVTSFSLSDGAKLIQWSPKGGINEHWRLVDFAGYEKLINRNSGKALSVDLGTADTDDIVQSAQNSGPEQQWSIVSVGGADRKIVNRKTGKVLAVSGGSADDGAAIIQSPYTSDPSQHWRVVKVN